MPSHRRRRSGEPPDPDRADFVAWLMSLDEDEVVAYCEQRLAREGANTVAGQARWKGSASRPKSPAKPPDG